eukprot:6705251-Prymnesium_polylepis.1
MKPNRFPSSVAASRYPLLQAATAAAATTTCVFSPSTSLFVASSPRLLDSTSTDAGTTEGSSTTSRRK